MREIRVSLGGTEITLKADFAASHRVATEVGDPLTIAREAKPEVKLEGDNEEEPGK